MKKLLSILILSVIVGLLVFLLLNNLLALATDNKLAIYVSFLLSLVATSESSYYLIKKLKK